jgi:regulator of sigma E protease
MSAGVLMNIVLAWAVYSAIGVAGTQFEDPITRFAGVDPALVPPEATGLAHVPMGTEIVRINGDTITSWNDVVRAIRDPGSDRLRFDFANGVEPVIVRIPGARADARLRLSLAVHNLRPPRVGDVLVGSPAAKAGLRPNDEIIRIAGDTVRYWDEMVGLVRPRPDSLVAVTYLRNGVVDTVELTVEAVTEGDDLTGARVRVGKLGVYPALQLRRVKFSLPGAVMYGARTTADQARAVLVTVRQLVTRQVSVRELAGPIGIGQISGQAARAGIVPFLSVLAFISVNLAILNILPIPVLDGGQLLFLLLEGLRGGRPLSLGIRLRLTQLGVLVLLMLVVLVMYNDLLRVFGLR